MRRHLVTASVAFFLAVSLPANAQDTAPVTCAYGELHTNAPPETEQFSFLIGEYSVTLHKWMGEAWSPAMPGVTARWNGYYTLGGMAIADEWFNPDPAQNPDASRGINVRMYDAEAGEWDMMWIDTASRQVSDLRAKVKDGVLTMWQVTPERPSFKAEFYVEDENRWSRITYTKEEDHTWTPTFKLNATRLPCQN